MSDKKILVTGGAGFIGLNITRILAKDPSNQITIIDDLSKGKMDHQLSELLECKNVFFLKSDLAVPSTWLELATDFDQIYHLAAIVGVRKVMANPVETLRINTLSTIYLLDYISTLRKKPKLTFASSCENYAGTVSRFNAPVPTPENVPLCVEDVFNPRWTYACSKTLGEIGCIQYAKQFKFETTVVRYHNVYGPRMGNDHVIPHLIVRMMKQQETFEIFGGNQYRTFCFVKDAAQMTINLMNSAAASGKVVNVGDDKNYFKIEDLARKLFAAKGLNPIIVERGAPKGSVQDRKPDLNLLRTLNCDVPSTPMELGLNDTVRWYTATTEKLDNAQAAVAAES